MNVLNGWSARKKGFAAAAAATLLGAGLAFITVGANAAGNSGGPATLTVASGGSTTGFSFQLPASPGDRCSADSASGGTFVYSYIAPASQSPGNITFNSDSGPDQAGVFPLYRTNGNAFISVNTAVGTGQVTSFPATQFNFNKFSANGTAVNALPSGEYNVGIACWNSNTNTQDKYWNTTVTFTASGSDPRGEVWGPFVPPTTVPPTTEPPTTVAPTTVPPTTEPPTTVPPTTEPPTTVPPTQLPPCTPPNGLISGLVYSLNPASLGALATSLCGLGL